MNVIIPPFAPGCFGSALAFDDQAPVCSVCKFAESCRPLHEHNLQILRDRVGVKGKGSKKAKNPLVDRPPADPAKLTVPKKVQELVDKLDKSNLRVTESFTKGVNPFASSSSFLKIAGHLLLKLRQPLDRQTLAYAFTSKLGWTEGTADSHARMTIQALTHIGAVVNIDGLISLRRG
ncbi:MULTISPECIES: hypothetical protein [unclassified Ensifer]|uniref:hypothetical protein n=1 Tax=unclassified Ensifer TaxID=2633371 RepID=UPI00081369F7|nr:MULTISPECIES: hypothetical protein [unclassified Ensifer]OCP22016.1 hypothetical protein BC361_25970 [Ensifer sp. LC54]OCP23204.1 hypothetical protein BC363_24795 [Ensifer sp. LC384]